MKNVIINGKVILEDSIKELNVFFENERLQKSVTVYLLMKQ